MVVMATHELVDPKNIFTSKLAKNITKLANNLVCDFEFAQKRFDEVIFQHIVLIKVKIVRALS